MSFDVLASGWAKVLGIDQKQFNMFFERMMDGFAYHKILVNNAGKPVDYVFLGVNSSFERLTGLRRENIIGKKATEVLPGIENDPADWIGVYGRVALSCEPTYFENYAKPLNRWFRVSAYCPQKGYFVALFEDITERKRAEEALSKSEQRWSTTLSSIGDAVITTDLNGNVSFLNRVAQGLTGWSYDEASGKPLTEIFNIVNEKTRAKVENPASRVLKEGIIIGLGNHTILVKKDGAEVPIDDSGAPIRDKEGNATGVVLVFRDITERKKFEKELFNLAKFPSENPDAVIRVDKDGVVLYANPQSQILPERLRQQTGQLVTGVWRGRVAEALSTNHMMEFEEAADGRFFLFKVAPIVSEGYVNVYGREITKRKRAEEKVAEQAFMLANANDAIIGYGFDQKVTFWNRAAEEMYGYTSAEVLGRTGLELLKPTYVSVKREDLINRLTSEGRAVSESLRQRKDGKTISVESHVILLRDETGKTIGYVSVDRDITERKKAEDALRASEEKYRHIVEHAPTAIYEIDFRAPKFKTVNDVMVKLSGYTREELMSKNPMDLLDAESQVRFKQRVQKALAGQEIDENVEYRAIIKDGSSRWVTLNLNLTKSDGSFDGALVVAYDTTERKQMLDKLEEYARNLQGLVEERTKELATERQRLYNVLETLPAYVILLDKDYNVAFANKVFRERFGESHGRHCYDFLFNRESPCPNCETYKVLQTGKPHEWEWTGPDERDYDIYDFPFLEADGSTLILEMGIDITERKKAEAKVKAASLYTRRLIEASPDPLVTISGEGKITDVNEATVRATGCSRKELIGTDFSDYFTEPEHAKKGYQKVFSDGYVLDYPLTLKTRSGKTIDVLYNASVYRNEKGKVQGVFAAARDVTELNNYRNHLEELVTERTTALKENQKKLELKAAEVEEYATNMEALAEERALKLKDAERLAAIGATAGMVGHDIRNPLQAIIGDVFLAQSDVAILPPSETKSSLIESLESIQKSVDYVNKIVQDLQDYAKPIKPATRDIDLKSIIEDVAKKTVIPKNIKFHRHIPENTQTIRSDPDLLTRILGNLIGNAVQAMPNGGALTIRAKKKKRDLVFTVKDTGKGIPEFAKPNLFTPLFTTKSKGQGFGLAVVKRMTEALGGTVTFESEEGKGAEFTIHLPQ